ncbi:13308_t:CDS:1, partial [Cetraspora pellucida]
HNNPYIKNNFQDKEQAENSIDTKFTTSKCISDNEKMALEDEVAESTINKEPVNTVNITDIKSTDSIETEVADSMVILDKINNNPKKTPFTIVTYKKTKTKNKRKDQARLSHSYKNEEGSQKGHPLRV